MKDYYIALATESTGWDILEEFEAEDDDAAEKYAEDHYPEEEWYVLDKHHRNIFNVDDA